MGSRDLVENGYSNQTRVGRMETIHVVVSLRLT